MRWYGVRWCAAGPLVCVEVLSLKEKADDVMRQNSENKGGVYSNNGKVENHEQSRLT